MFPLIHPLTAIVSWVSLVVAAGYGVVSLAAVLVWQIRVHTAASASLPATSRRLPPVTILKPLCGAEPALYEHLRSFCQQDYPEFQIVFGVRDPADPAIKVVEALIVEFPSLPIEVVINSQQHGTNYKNSNLMNMLARASYDVFVIADSDTWVRPDYLAVVTGPLLDHDVGLVTCLYLGVPTRGIWSRLGAMYFNEWYAPSVLLAWLFGHRGYASGQTLCLRRDTLDAIGGLQAIANELADDYRLGELIREAKLRIVLSSYMVNAEHDEPSLDALTRHELRWMRTIGVLRPRSFRLIFSTFSLPLAVLGIVLDSLTSSLSMAGWALFGITAVARLGLHFVPRLRGERALLSDIWLIPARDVLICWVWWRSFFTSRLTWRGSEFNVGRDGVMHRPS